MKENTYNGWTNYATWRVNLEIFDSMELGDFWGFSDQEPSEVNASELGEALKEYVHEIIDLDCSSDSLANSYANAFISDANWNEIASHMIENAKEYA